MMRRILRTRRRKIAALTTVLVLAFAGTALAYYLISSGAGSGSATLGAAPTGTLTLHVSFANGLSPGGSEPVTITASNSTTSPGVIHSLGWSGISSTVTGCDTTAFTLTWPGGGSASAGALTFSTPISVAAGATAIPVAVGTLAFTNTAVDQSACQNAPLTLAFTSN